jgi:hypothetical protein
LFFETTTIIKEEMKHTYIAALIGAFVCLATFVQAQEAETRYD